MFGFRRSMFQDNWLDSFAAQILARVAEQQPRFVIELDLDEVTIGRCFQQLSRFRPCDISYQWRSCVAVAAVHAAARADADEKSFIAVFFDRLRRNLSSPEWREYYGPYIRGWIEENDFGVELPERGLAWCYVGCVYRHAGIPVPARPSFVYFVAGLLERHLYFSRDHFSEALGGVLSWGSRRFLESETGFQFTRWIADRARRLRQNLITDGDLESLPTFQRELVSAVAAQIAAKPALTARASIQTDYASPYLAFDEARQRLVVRFDPRGISRRAYRTAEGVVQRAELPAPDEDAFCYQTEPDWRRIELHPWWRTGQSESALFRMSDGAFVASEGLVRPGEYWLVTRYPESVPTDIIRQESGCLVAEGFTADYYTVYAVEIPAAYEHAAVPFTTGAPSTGPELVFAEGGPVRAPFGHNIFIGGPPRVRVRNWSPQAERQHFVELHCQSGIQRLRVGSDDVLIVEQHPPLQGEFRIERKDFARQNTVSSLSYSMVPAGIALLPIGRCAAEAESVKIRVSLQPGWSVKWNDLLRELDATTCEAPGYTRAACGELRHGICVIPISVRLPRVAMHRALGGVGDAIIWRERAETEGEFLVEGLPGTHYRLLLRSAGQDCLIRDLGTMPERGMRRLPSGEFCDALAKVDCPAGEFVLADSTRTYATGLHFASAVLLQSSIASSPPDSPVFALPRIGRELAVLRSLADMPFRAVNLSTLSQTPLRGFVSDVLFCAAELDYAIVEEEADYEAGVSNPVRLAVDWFADADASVADFPSGALPALPLQRWVDLLQQRCDELAAHAELPRSRDGLPPGLPTAVPAATREAKDRTPLVELEAAARKLEEAVRQPDVKCRNQILTRVCEICRQVLEDDTFDQSCHDAANVLYDEALRRRQEEPIRSTPQ